MKYIHFIFLFNKQFKLQHIYREANFCADILAKIGCIQHLDFISFVTPSSHALEALKFCCFKTMCTRQISC